MSAPYVDQWVEETRAGFDKLQEESMQEVIVEDRLEPEKPPVPFCTCLKHELKTSTMRYVFYVSLFIDCLTAIVLFFVLQNAGINFSIAYVHPLMFLIFDAIRTMVATAVGIALSQPLWVYAVLALISPPLVYSMVVCINKRLDDKAREAIVESFTISTMVAWVCACAYMLATHGLTPATAWLVICGGILMIFLMATSHVFEQK